jgi:hypothetical protein
MTEASDLVGDGKKTIDRVEIEETFKQLQLGVDLSNLKRLGEIRNDIEHLHPTHAPALIQEAIADAMPIIRDVIVKELNEQPSALLSQEAWDALLDQAQVFKAEQDASRTSFDSIDWESEALAAAFREFRCPHCSSSLLRNDNSAAKRPSELILICSKCGEHAVREDVIEAAIDENLGWEAHVEDGGDAPFEIARNATARHSSFPKIDAQIAGSSLKKPLAPSVVRKSPSMSIDTVRPDCAATAITR